MTNITSRLVLVICSQVAGSGDLKQAVKIRQPAQPHAFALAVFIGEASLGALKSETDERLLWLSVMSLQANPPNDVSVVFPRTFSAPSGSAFLGRF